MRHARWSYHRQFQIRAQEWQRFNTTDSQGVPTEVHISAHKSQVMVKRELVFKQLKSALFELRPQHNFHSNRAKGEVSLQWEPIIRGVPRQDGDVPAIEYIAHFNFNRDEIEREVATIVRPPEPVSWRVEPAHLSVELFFSLSLSGFIMFPERSFFAIASDVSDAAEPYASSRSSGLALSWGSRKRACRKLKSRTCCSTCATGFRPSSFSSLRLLILLVG
ncbi:unnamed protein product [Prorocentrum cordatum]|uniref:Uncharacterized protein n=1 Tax=Prorocentrum cordatum TaxID=2364126 RepID=A0ABN9UI31_9DINO|nr:unnamed protein product [Polarella glacialis]